MVLCPTICLRSLPADGVPVRYVLQPVGRAVFALGIDPQGWCLCLSAYVCGSNHPVPLPERPLVPHWTLPAASVFHPTGLAYASQQSFWTNFDFSFKILDLIGSCHIPAGATLLAIGLISRLTLQNPHIHVAPLPARWRMSNEHSGIGAWSVTVGARVGLPSISAGRCQASPQRLRASPWRLRGVSGGSFVTEGHDAGPCRAAPPQCRLM